MPIGEEQPEGSQVPVDEKQMEESPEDYEFSPEQQDMIDNYVVNAIKIIHSPKSADAIIEALKSINNPQAAVAKTANLVHDMIAMSSEQNGKNFNSVALMLGSSEMIDELIDLGEAAKCFPKLSDAQRYAAHQLAMQHYFGRGIEEGWIDPIALQKDVEPLMPEDMRNRGRAIMDEMNRPQGRSKQILPTTKSDEAEALLR